MLSACAAAVARPLLPSHLQHLQQHRYAVVPNWLPDDLIDRLQVDAVEVNGELGEECSIGVVRDGSRTFQPGVRRSRQVAFYPPPPNSAGCTRSRSLLIDAVGGLRWQLQEAEELEKVGLGEPVQICGCARVRVTY